MEQANTTTPMWNPFARIDAARHGPAAQVIPVLIPVQAGLDFNKKFVLSHLYIWPFSDSDNTSL